MRSKRQENKFPVLSSSCDGDVILASGPDLLPLCEKWHVAGGMHSSGEVRFLASSVQTSTPLITTQDINARLVKTIMWQREKLCGGVKQLSARSSSFVEVCLASLPAI